MTNHRVSRQWIWKFIVFLYLIYLVEAMLLAVIGLVVSKVSRGNIEAFTIMSVILRGIISLCERVAAFGNTSILLSA